MTKDTGASAPPKNLLDEDDLSELEAATAELEPGIDRNHPVLTVAEQRAAIEAAKKSIEKEKRQAALKELQARTERELRGADGLSTGNPGLDEIVHVTIDLPDYAPSVVFNMGLPGEVHYYPGQTYKVPRHVANSIREQMHLAWRHQNEIEGKTRTDLFRRPQAQVLSGGGL